MGAVYICAFARHPPSLALGMSRSKALGRSKLSTMLYLFMMSSERLRTTVVEGRKKKIKSPSYIPLPFAAWNFYDVVSFL